jgi:hypothetical protein
MPPARDPYDAIANGCGNTACGRSRSGFRNAPEFAREAHRQSTLVANSEQDLDDQAFVDAVSSDWDETT